MTYCKGDFKLGTACGECERCLKQMVSGAANVVSIVRPNTSNTATTDVTPFVSDEEEIIGALKELLDAIDLLESKPVYSYSVVRAKTARDSARELLVRLGLN